MQMTEGEILRSYREAKNPKEQIKVLAELNAVPKDTIIDILIEQGVDEKELPKRRKPKVNKTVTVSEPKGINVANAAEHLEVLITALQLYKQQNSAELDAAVARAENTAKRIDSALEFVRECMRE